MATVLPRPVYAYRVTPLATDLVAAVAVAGLCAVEGYEALAVDPLARSA